VGDYIIFILYSLYIILTLYYTEYTHFKVTVLSETVNYYVLLDYSHYRTSQYQMKNESRSPVSKYSIHQIIFKLLYGKYIK